MSAGPKQVQATGGPGMEFLEFLAAQRADYRRGLDEKCARMATLWGVIADGDGDAAAILELERQAHSLAGSGATFGYRDLGEAAKALEIAVHRLSESGSTRPSGAQRTGIAGAMLAVNELIPAGTDETPEGKPC